MAYFFGFLIFLIVVALIIGVTASKTKKEQLDKKHLDNKRNYSAPSGRPDSPISRHRIKSSSPNNIPTSRQQRMDTRKANERKREQKQDNYMDQTNPSSPLYLFNEEINSNKSRHDDNYDTHTRTESYSSTRSYSDDSPSSYGSSDYGSSSGSSGGYDSGGSFGD